MDFFGPISRRPFLSSIICVSFWFLIISGSLFALVTRSDESNTESGFTTPDHLESAQGAEYLNDYLSVNSSLSLIIHSQNASLLTKEVQMLVSQIKTDIIENEHIFRALSIDEPVVDVFSLSEGALRNYFVSIWYISQTVRGSALAITGASSTWSEAFWVNYQESANITIAAANASLISQEVIESKLDDERLNHYISIMEKTNTALVSNWTSWSETNMTEITENLVYDISDNFLHSWDIPALIGETLSITDVAIATVNQLSINENTWEESNNTIEIAAFQSFGVVDNSSTMWISQIYNSTIGLSSANNLVDETLLGLLNGTIVLPGDASSFMTYFLNRLVGYNSELGVYNTIIMNLHFQEKRSSEIGTKAIEQMTILLDLWRDRFPDFELFLTGFDLLLWEEEIQISKDALIIDILVVLAILAIILLVKRNFIFALFSLTLAIIALIVGRAIYLFLLPEEIGKTNEGIILMTVITLAAAVDSNIFLFSRFQEEMLKNSKKKSLASTFKNTLPSVFTSLVAILSSFSIFAFSSFTIFYSASIAVSIGLLVNMFEIVTLTPSIIWLFGDKLAHTNNHLPDANSDNGKKTDLKKNDKSDSEGIISRIITKGAKYAIKSPYTVMTAFSVVTILSLLIIVLSPVTFNNVYLAPESYESSKGYIFVEDEIGYSYLSKVYITIVLPEGDQLIIDDEINWRTYNLVSAFSSSLSELDHVVDILSPTIVNHAELADILNSSSYLDRNLARVYMDMTLANNSGFCIIELSMDKPDMSDEMLDMVEIIRALRDNFLNNNPCYGWEILVTGASALLYDVKTELISEIVKLSILVILLTLIILSLLLQSFFVTFRILITIIMSIIVSLGLFYLIMNLFGLKVYWLVPPFLFIVMNGLANDFDLILLGRIREEVNLGEETNDAIIKAIRKTGPSISLCALVMAFSFLSNVVSHSAMVKQIGLGLFIAVLIDGFIIRAIVVPAALTMFGKYSIPLINKKNDLRNQEGANQAHDKLKEQITTQEDEK